MRAPESSLRCTALGAQSLLGPQDKQATTRSGRICKLTERFLSMDRDSGEPQDTATHPGEPLRWPQNPGLQPLQSPKFKPP